MSKRLQLVVIGCLAILPGITYSIGVYKGRHHYTESNIAVYVPSGKSVRLVGDGAEELLDFLVPANGQPPAVLLGAD